LYNAQKLQNSKHKNDKVFSLLMNAVQQKFLQTDTDTVANNVRMD